MYIIIIIIYLLSIINIYIWNHKFSVSNKFYLIQKEYSKIELINIKNYNINDLIFVSIASFRDSECHRTIKSLIYKSNNWRNLRICVCQQNNTNDIDCLYKLPRKYHSIINIINLYYLEARGPTKARYLIQKEYSCEEYYLQIDSHTLFKKNWDIKLKNTLNILPKKSCLTQYLPEYDTTNTTNQTQNTTNQTQNTNTTNQTQNTNTKKINKLRGELKVVGINLIDGFTRINSNYSKLTNNIFESNSWSASFSFSNGDICKDAPIDPYTPHLFFGEELDITLRLYTRNWNFYSPNYIIAHTKFNRDYRKTFWENSTYNYNTTICSRLRVHYRLGTTPVNIKLPEELLIDSEKYTLGNVRTLKNYEKLIGFTF